MKRLPRGTLIASVAIAVLLGLPASVAHEVEGTCVEGLMIDIQHDENIIGLSWDATPGALSYEVHLDLEGGGSEPLATLDGSETSFVHDPAPDGVLEYRVAANGHPSDECPSASAHLGGEDPFPPEPFCVTGVSGQALADGSIRIQWPAQEPDVSFDVLRGVGSETPTPLAFVSAGATEFVDTTTTPGVAHTYEVHANGLLPAGECPQLALVAVPFFGGGLALLVGLGAVGAFIMTRRRG